MGKPETQEEKYKTMTEKPVSSLICRLAVPTIILYNKKVEKRLKEGKSMGKPETQEEKYKTMTEKPVSSLICRLAVPTIISMLVTSFYNMADTFFVARIGTSATAAVGVSFALMAIIQAFGFFCGHGSGNYISRTMGQHRFDEAQQMAATGFFTHRGGRYIVFVDGDYPGLRLFLRPRLGELYFTQNGAAPL